MDAATIAVMISAATFLVMLMQNLFGGGWRLKGQLSSMEMRLRAAIETSRTEIEERQDRGSHDIGEAFAAMREKIREVELFSRDTFVRRDEFNSAIRELG